MSTYCSLGVGASQPQQRDGPQGEFIEVLPHTPWWMTRRWHAGFLELCGGKAHELLGIHPGRGPNFSQVILANLSALIRKHPTVTRNSLILAMAHCIQLLHSSSCEEIFIHIELKLLYDFQIWMKISKYAQLNFIRGQIRVWPKLVCMFLFVFFKCAHFLNYSEPKEGTVSKNGPDLSL